MLLDVCACGAHGEMRRVATIITYHYVTLVASSLFLAVKMESPPYLVELHLIKKPRYCEACYCSIMNLANRNPIYTPDINAIRIDI